MSVAFVREESAEVAQEVRLPPRAISANPNPMTRSGLVALERALADSQQALKAAHAIADSNDRRRALESTARDVRYFAERVASAVPQPEPGHTVVVAFGSRVTILRDDDCRQTFRIEGEDEADPRGGSIAYVSPLARLLIGKRVGEAVELASHEIKLSPSSRVTVGVGPPKGDRLRLLDRSGPFRVRRNHGTHQGIHRRPKGRAG
jgi:transcription elongation GreA/GreB family factor